MLRRRNPGAGKGALNSDRKPEARTSHLTSTSLSNWDSSVPFSSVCCRHRCRLVTYVLRRPLGSLSSVMRRVTHSAVCSGEVSSFATRSSIVASNVWMRRVLSTLAPYTGEELRACRSRSVKGGPPWRRSLSASPCEVKLP
jgi:hypothetical protein